MKSLQVLTPKRKCIYDCPFCISKTHKHNNDFDNLIENNFMEYKKRLKNILQEYKDLKNIVITGVNEPMQDKEIIKKIVKIIREERCDINIELQTKFLKKDPIYESFDVIAFSISNFNELKLIPNIRTTTRAVILLTNSFSDKKLIEMIRKVNVDQITLKRLHDSNGFNPKIDNWIQNNKIKNIENLKKEISNYKGNISIRLDLDCMNAEDRYMVFREDGNLYKDFYEEKSR